MGATIGIWSGSTALIAAALDNLGDASVYAVSLFATGRGLRVRLFAARLSGYVLIVLTALLVIEVLRRFLGAEAAQGLPMILMAGLNFGFNLVCLKILSPHRGHGVHFRAASLFTSNDSIVNFGIALSGTMVMWLGSNCPDLVIGLIVAVIAGLGGKEILDDANDAARSWKDS